jgi:hypothetical protein
MKNSLEFDVMEGKNKAAGGPKRKAPSQLSRDRAFPHAVTKLVIVN